jgi:hypothetical protein
VKKRMEITGKTDYKRNRVISGHAPHKLLKMEIKKYLDKKKQEADLFDINKKKWKELGE